MSMNRDILSVIVPVVERVNQTVEVFEAYDGALRATGRDYEFLYILDGHYPEVRATLEALQVAGHPVRIFQLGRSFGEATALSIGFENARGETLLTLSANLQVEPSSLPRLVEALADNDMVVVRRWPRTDPALNSFQTRLFSHLVGYMTGVHLQDLACSIRILRKSVANAVPVYGDQHRFFSVLVKRWGFSVKEIELPQSSAQRSRRLYRPGVYIRRLLDVLTVFFLIKFTKKPLRFFGLIGTGIGAIGALALAYLVVARMFGETALADRPALLLASLLLVLGVQIFGLGLIGELIIFTHAKDIKEYNVREIVNDESENSVQTRVVTPPDGAVTSTSAPHET
jgi:glycosyltransferase involved in cell wall biosynthesis